jgi:phosphohistidine phosphatase SixA
VPSIHLVRHADAGHAPDEERMLTPEGRDQAARVAMHLADAGVTRILSSRYRRCMETVAPLAAELGLVVETHKALSEEADLEAAWSLVESLQGTDTVICSHGNVIAPLLDRVLRRGAAIDASEWTCHKASIWRLENDKDRPIARAVLVVSRA